VHLDNRMSAFFITERARDMPGMPREQTHSRGETYASGTWSAKLSPDMKTRRIMIRSYLIV